MHFRHQSCSKSLKKFIFLIFCPAFYIVSTNIFLLEEDSSYREPSQVNVKDGLPVLPSHVFFPKYVRVI